MFGSLKYDHGQDLANAYPELQLPNSGYQTNNNYNHFPPFMQDGRSVLSTLGPESQLDANLSKKEGIQSNWQYRQYLMANSEMIRDKMFTDSLSDVGFSKNGDMNHTETIRPPQLYGSVHDPTSHVQAMPSDLKETYLTREQLQDKLVVPSMTQEQLVRQWQQ
jgi:hypothetical protein